MTKFNVEVRLCVYATDWLKSTQYRFSLSDGTLPRFNLAGKIDTHGGLDELIEENFEINPLFVGHQIIEAVVEGDKVIIFYRTEVPYDTVLRQGKWDKIHV